MENKEAFKLCLDDKIVEREQLTKELEETILAYEKARCETHMYDFFVTHKGENYAKLFNEKQRLSKENEDNLRNKRNNIEKELKLLKIEIEYLETQTN